MLRSTVRNMTEGNISRLLLSFAAPMMLGNLFQQMYNLADSIIVGNLVGGYSLGAIGACSSLNNTIFGFCNGLSLGVGVAIAQLFGAKRHDEVRRAIVNGLILVLLITVALSTVCAAFSGQLLRVLQTPEEYIDESAAYFRIVCGGMLGVAAYNGVAAILRALGDSKTPLLFLLLACFVNIGLDLVFVLVYHMGVAGTAVATVLSQMISAAACTFYAVRTNDYFRLRKEDRVIDRRLIMRCLRVGIPIGFQNSLISFSSVALQWVVNGFGPDAATAYTMTVRLEQLIQQPYASVSAAMSAFAGQNIGAHKLDRVRQAVRICLKAIGAFSAVMCLVMHLFGRSVLGIFGKDPVILDIAVKAIGITSCFYFALGVIYLIRGLSNGAGDATQAMLNGIVEILSRIGFALLLTRIPVIGMWGIWITTAATWCTAAMECVIRYRQGKWMRQT